MSRPRIEIDTAQFENLCKLQCTLGEIAGWFNCSEDTIERWTRREYKKPFAEVFKEKRQAGKIALRRNLLRMSEHNPATAIFLAKNWLGMTDRMEAEIKTKPDDESIRFMEEYFSANVRIEDDGK